MAPFRNRSIAARHGWLLVCAILFFALSPIAGVAQDATPVAGDATTVDASPSPTPTPVPPTQTPTPESTPAPTPEPTATPTPQLAPTPELIPTPELTPTPAVTSLAPDIESAEAPAGDLAILSIDDSEGIACQQISPGDDVVTAGEYVVFRCDNAPSSQLGPNGALNFYLKVHAITPGWRLSYAFAAMPTGDPGTHPAGWMTPSSIPSGSLHSGNGITQAHIALGPASDTVAMDEGTVSIEFLQGRDHQTPGASYASPRTAALGATHGTPPTALPCLPSVSAGTIDFGTSTSTGAGYTPVQTTVALTVTVAGVGCSGMPDAWRIQASTQGYARGGGGGAIPAGALAYTGSSGAAPSGLTPAAPVSLDASPRIIATGNADLTSGATWNATFTLTPPSTAPPGTYTGTITLDVAVGD